MSAADDDACDCPFCRDDVPPEIVERIKAAAAAPMLGPMTASEFRVWLYALEPSVEPPV